MKKVKLKETWQRDDGLFVRVSGLVYDGEQVKSVMFIAPNNQSPWIANPTQNGLIPIDQWLKEFTKIPQPTQSQSIAR